MVKILFVCHGRIYRTWRNDCKPSTSCVSTSGSPIIYQHFWSVRIANHYTRTRRSVTWKIPSLSGFRGGCTKPFSSSFIHFDTTTCSYLENFWHVWLIWRSGTKADGLPHHSDEGSKRYCRRIERPWVNGVDRCYEQRLQSGRRNCS